MLLRGRGVLKLIIGTAKVRILQRHGSINRSRRRRERFIVGRKDDTV